MRLNTEEKRNPVLEWIVGLQLLSPLLVYYNIPFTTIGVTTAINLLSLIIGITFVIFDRKIIIRKKSFEGAFAIYVAFLIIETIALSFLADYKVETGMTFINMVFVAIILLIYPSRIRTTSCLKIYKAISYISIGMFLIQLLLDLVAGIHADLHIPFLTLQEVNVSAFKTTSAAFFSEPAHLAQYISPLIVISLFDEKGPKDSVLPAILLTIVCLFTLSGNGMVVCFILWVIYYVLRIKAGNTHGLVWLFVGIIFFVIALTILSRIPAFMKVANRLFYDRTGDIYTYTKADYRIYRGFDYFFQLPVLSKIFGIGYRALDSFSSYMGLSSQYDTRQSAEYLNAICQIMIYSGLVGFVLYIRSVTRLGKASSLVGKIILIVYLALSVSSSILLDNTMIMFVLIVASHKKGYLQCLKEEREGKDGLPTIQSV